MKAAANHALDEVQAGRLSYSDCVSEIRRISSSVPGLDQDKYSAQIAKLLAMSDTDRARRLVECIEDRTFRAWVVPSAKVLWTTVKLSALAAFVWFVVWLAT